MTLNDLLNNFLRFENKRNSVEDVLTSFGSWLKFDPESNKLLSNEEIEEINCLIVDLIKAYRYFLTGQISNCYNEVYSILFSHSYAKKIFTVTQEEPDSVFYRMRQSEDEYLLSKEEMFHIPFHLRERISNQRFSLTGFPCLYLGRSIYVCWEELNRPKFDNANIVGLKTVKKLNLLDLRMPTEFVVPTDFYRIPLILATTVKVQNPNCPFKPEYIISQSILHAIVSHNNSFNLTDNINGII